MAATITAFADCHISDALQLWQTTEHIGLSSADTPQALSAFLARNPKLSFCAIRSGELVGTILCGCDGRRGYIHHLAVSDASRRENLASRLVTQSLSALASIGIGKCIRVSRQSLRRALLGSDRLGTSERLGCVVENGHTKGRRTG
jgi:ribosomal protein S18 acetylase RimI-like enzyme